MNTDPPHERPRITSQSPNRARATSPLTSTPPEAEVERLQTQSQQPAAAAAAQNIRGVDAPRSDPVVPIVQGAIEIPDDDDSTSELEPSPPASPALPSLPQPSADVFVCTVCNIHRAIRRLAGHQDEGEVCDYCAEDRTGQDPEKEKKWCFEGAHEVARIKFMRWWGGEWDSTCADCAPPEEEEEEEIQQWFECLDCHMRRFLGRQQESGRCIWCQHKFDGSKPHKFLGGERLYCILGKHEALHQHFNITPGRPVPDWCHKHNPFNQHPSSSLGEDPFVPRAGGNREWITPARIAEEEDVADEDEDEGEGEDVAEEDASDSDEEFKKARFRMPAGDRWAKGGSLRQKRVVEGYTSDIEPEVSDLDSETDTDGDGVDEGVIVGIGDAPPQVPKGTITKTPKAGKTPITPATMKQTAQKKKKKKKASTQEDTQETDPQQQASTLAPKKKPKKPSGRPKVPEDQRVAQVKKMINNWRITEDDFLRLWFGEPGSKQFKKLMGKVQQGSSSSTGEWFSMSMLRNDVKKLIGKEPFFGRYNPALSTTPVDLQEIDSIIKRHAPHLHACLWKLLPNQYKDDDDEDPDGEQGRIRKRVTTIVTMAVHSVALIKSSWFTKSLSVFLLTSGVKARVVDVLNNMGVCGSYKNTQQLLKMNAEHQMDLIREMAKDPRSEWTYDNFNRQKRRREQVVGDTNEQWNMTTSYIRINPYIPFTGLTQDMLDFKIDLDVDDIIQDLINDEWDEKVFMSLIEQSWVAVVGEDVIAGVWARSDEEDGDAEQPEQPEQPDVDAMIIDEGADVNQAPSEPKPMPPQRPKWPVIEENEPIRSEILSLPVSSFEEQSVQGTYAMQEDIFINMSGLDRKKDFRTRMIIVNGDCLSIERARSCKLESLESVDDFERRQWCLPNMAKWHEMMNCANTVYRTHWERNDDGELLAHSLKRAADYWGLKNFTNQNPKFYQTQKVQIRLFHSCVVGQGIQLMADNGHPIEIAPEQDEMSAFKHAVSKLTKRQLLGIWRQTYDQSFTPEAWEGTNHQGDNTFTTQARLLIQIARAITYRNAIRNQDVGHLRRLVNQSIVPFYGAGQNNYGKNMIYQRWLLSDAADPVLQEALLGAATVNPSGRYGKAVASDEMLELHNLEYSEDISRTANPSDLAATFRRKSLNREASRVIRGVLERGISYKRSSAHTSKKAGIDVFSLADKMVKEGSAGIRPGHGGALSLDIETIGSKVLREKVDEFNAGLHDYSRGVTGAPVVVDETEDPYSNQDPGDIEDAIIDEQVDEEYLFWGDAADGEGDEDLLVG